MSRRFPRAQRLTKAVEFQAVFDNARACSGEHFTLLAKANNLSAARLGLAVSKRRLALAVRRNAVKRIVRESFRCHQAELPALDIVVIAKQAAASADRRRLRAGLDRLWPRLAAAVLPPDDRREPASDG